MNVIGPVKCKVRFVSLNNQSGKVLSSMKIHRRYVVNLLFSVKITLTVTLILSLNPNLNHNPNPKIFHGKKANLGAIIFCEFHGIIIHRSAPRS